MALPLEALLVTAAVIVTDGRVLLTRRAAGGLAGLWEFPGGKVEPGESEEECLHREIREELGLTIRVERFLGENLHRYPAVTVRLRAWLCSCLAPDAGEIRLADHDAFAWATAVDLPDFDLAPADIPLLDLLLGILKNETGAL
ncbi:MAG TPA: (deoxy)nucleoside triphosphate pyrophosphohydrolase [Verrucomicrobiales bacterium]|nr:(deoxy)nucleoside triphosphate pyrophosphohydrolase [Verrucomicrobiales bacterium]